jgi:hypothetical protein
LWYGTAPGKYTAQVNVGFLMQYAVSGLADGTTYCFAVQAYDRNGAKSPLSTGVCGDTPAAPPPAEEPPPDPEPPTDPPPSGTAGDVVLYAAKAGVVKGNWVAGASAGAAGGRAIRSEDRGWSAANAPLAAPTSYFEMTFPAAANTPYTVWLRLRAANNSKWNDAVWVQFSDALVSGNARYRIGTTNALLVNLEPCDGCGTSGWGWQNSGYWLTQATTVTFANSGTHTIRVQTREDGAEIDQIVLSPMKYLSTAPGPAKGDATILAETATAPAAETPTVSEIVRHASDATGIRGNWARVASAGAAGGQAMRSADRGWSSPDRPLAAPEHSFDVTFDAPANTQYRVWLRLRATGNSKWNDAVWVQFSDALVNGNPKYRTGTTEGLLVNLERCEGCGVSGWGWQNTAYWLNQGTVVTFANSGTHRLRVQTREDGVEIDQVVLSAVKYKSAAPGSATNDATILANSTAASGSTATSAIAAATTTPYAGEPFTVPGLIDAAHFDEGDAGVAYADSTSGNNGGVFRTTDVDLQSSSLGGYNIAWTTAGEWVTYTANVQSAGAYYVRLRVASRGGGALQIAAGAPSNSARDVAVPDTRDGQNWTTVTVPLTLAAGTQTVTVRFLTGNVSLRDITLKK